MVATEIHVGTSNVFDGGHGRSGAMSRGRKACSGVISNIGVCVSVGMNYCNTLKRNVIVLPFIPSDVYVYLSPSFNSFKNKIS